MLKNLEKKLDTVLQQYNSIQTKLTENTLTSKDRISLSKKFSILEQVLQKKDLIEKTEKTLNETKELLKEEIEPELLEMAKLDIDELEKTFEDQNNSLKQLLIPKDVDDEKNAIIEIRAGTGGYEAALFSMVL